MKAGRIPSELEYYEERFTQVDQSNFTLKHLTDESEDLNVQQIVDWEGRAVLWKGLHLNLAFNME